MKLSILIFGMVVAFSTLLVDAASAQSYNSQRARQDREYKSLSKATARAFAPPRTNTTTPTRRTTTYRR